MFNKIILVLTSVALTACSSNGYYRNAYSYKEFISDSNKIKEGKAAILELDGIPREELSPELLEEYKDAIHEDDVLNIAMYHPSRPDLTSITSEINNSIGYRVANGQITLPELGKIHVAGIPIEEAEEKLRQELGKEISGIEIFVSYKDRPAESVDLIGMVQIPRIPVNGKRRLYEILANAGLANEANLFMSYVIRDENILPVDIYRLVKMGDMKHNVVMRGGDKIYIAKPFEAKIIVFGEVRHQGLIPLSTGYMPLPEALVASGGFNYLTANLRHIYVIRGNLSKPKVYKLSWKHIVNSSNYNLLLVSGDIVYVASKPITRWNRFISQLLPTAEALDRTTRAITNVQKFVE